MLTWVFTWCVLAGPPDPGVATGAGPPAAPDRAPKLTAEVRTPRGLIRIELEAERAPLTVANFVTLAGRGFYDGLTFYLVVAGATVEAGCPLNKGIAGPGYTFRDEFHPRLRHDAPGIVSMANAGPNTNGSRFAIDLRAIPARDGHNPVFGRVVDGLDVVARIRDGDVIESVVIRGTPPDWPASVRARLADWNRILDAKFPAKPRTGPAPSAPKRPAGTLKTVTDPSGAAPAA